MIANIDATDRKILMQLQANSKQHIKEIAQQVGLSLTPTYERIKKLEQQGLIKAYVAILDRRKINKELIAYCQISLIQHQKELIDRFKAEVSALESVLECHHISGNFDFLLKIAVADMNDFQVFINDKLSVVKGIATIHNSFVMNSVKESTAYIL